eukprot:7384377-Heterocapsa_arctica.AAC.1
MGLHLAIEGDAAEGIAEEHRRATEDARFQEAAINRDLAEATSRLFASNVGTLIRATRSTAEHGDDPSNQPPSLTAREIAQRRRGTRPPGRNRSPSPGRHEALAARDAADRDAFRELL